MKTRKLISAILALLMFIPILTAGMTAAETDLPFTDVKKNWSYEPIKYVYEAGLMNGTGDGTTFSPNMNLSRGMVVTVLYRNDGSPKGNYADSFVDVSEGKYYSTAAAWAFENGIVNGTGNNEWGEPLFSPDNKITRQELATMFARYAAYRHVDTTRNTADIASFPDSGNVAKWATGAMKWVVGTGLITGKGNGAAATLSPKDNASRAEFATIIQRYILADNAREFTYHLAFEPPVPLNSYTKPEYTLVKDADLYVAVDGNDKNPGTFEEPLATFEGARDKVRELKKTAADEIVVAFKEGEYGVLNNISFFDVDAGTEAVPIKYCAYGDGDVIFRNGIKLSENDFKPITEQEAARFPAEAVKNIYKIELDGKIDEVNHKTLVFSETTVCHQARLPNKKASGLDAYYEGFTTTYDERSSILLQGPLPELVDSFSTVNGLKATGFLRTGWLVDTFPVKSFDAENGILAFDFDDPICFENGYTLDTFPLAFEGRMQDTVFFSNLPDFLDDKNEYWFDPDTKILYMYKPEGDYTVSTAGSFMYVNFGADYLTFEGLEFNTTTADAITVVADHVTFDKCTVGNVGGMHAIFCYATNNFTAVDCELYNFVSDGIRIDVDSDTDLNLIKENHNVIRNCYFHDFSLPQYWAHGILLQGCVGAIIENNHFVNGAHAAIRFDHCIDTIIQSNVFDNMMMTTADYGAVYTFREVCYRGNIIRNNIFKNIRSAYGQYSIYLDGSYGVEVYGNLFYNGGNHNIVFNDGRDNDVHDNININVEHSGDFLMYNAGPYALLKDPGKQEDVDALINNYGQKPAPGEEGYEIWLERWPILYDYNFDKESVGDFNSFYSTINYVKRNKFFGTKENFGEIYELFGEKEANEEFTLEENPYFADPTHGDYTIVKNADDFDSRYIFDFSKVGIQ